MNRRLLCIALAMCAPLAAPAAAQSAAPGGTGFSISVSPIYEPDASLDRGGKAGVRQTLVFGGVATQVTPRLRAGVDLSYARAEWRFDNPTAFGGAAPFKTVDRFGLSVPLTWAIDRWRLGVAPTIELAREPNARAADSLIYGALFSGTRIFSERLALGVGVIAFDRLEETRVFPFPIVSWQINPRMRLANPFPAGPAGPAGLELGYALDDGWSVGTGATFRSYRFRLDQGGRYPNGVGETSGAPVYVRLSRQFNRTIRGDLWAGASFNQQIRVQDARGNDITYDKQGTVPFLAFTVSARF